MSKMKSKDVDATVKETVDGLFKNFADTILNPSDENDKVKKVEKSKNDEADQGEEQYVTPGMLKSFGESLVEGIGNMVEKLNKSFDAKLAKAIEPEEPEEEDDDEEEDVVEKGKSKNKDKESDDVGISKDELKKTIKDTVNETLKEREDQDTRSMRKSFVVNKDGALLKSVGDEFPDGAKVLDVENMTEEEFDALPESTQEKIANEDFNNRLSH